MATTEIVDEAGGLIDTWDIERREAAEEEVAGIGVRGGMWRSIADVIQINTTARNLFGAPNK